MWCKGLLLLALFLCIYHRVNSQGNSTTITASSAGSSNQTSSQNVNETNLAPVTQFMLQMVRGNVWGVHKCKKAKDCGLGLRCDLLLNLCVPFNTPLLTDIEKPCLNQSECSPMHSCQGGFCRFCGPKSCKSNMDCCAGSFAEAGKPGKFYECLNLEDHEKLALAKQLGRVPANYQPLPKAAGGKSPEDEFGVESEELLHLGQTAQGDQAMYGKRCWARCNTDDECYGHGAPQDVRKNIGCCNGVCSRRQSCVSASPQAIQQMQLLQQQQQQQLVIQQQQQQQLLQQQQQQQHLLHAHAHAHVHQGVQHSQWAAHSHPQQLQWEPRPASWQEAQQQKPTWGQPQGAQQQQQQQQTTTTAATTTGFF